jgi:hypothetical protein
MSAGHERLLGSRRGSAMVETVAVLGFILALLFGSAQIVLSGFYQLQLDAATFLYSHSYAMTNSVPTAQLQSVVPVVMPTQMTTIATSPPYTNASDPNGLTVLGEYTTGGTPSGAASAYTDRYGGASIIRPQQIVTQGTLTLPVFDLSIFSAPPTMTAGNIEGRSMVANHDDDSTGFDYNSTSANGNLVSPDTTGGDDQNVPPYYFPRAIMKECPYDAAGGTGFYNCASSQTVYALGLAEFLQDASYSGAQNGNYTISGNGIGSGAMFGAMTYHQQVYATLAQWLTTPQYSSYDASHMTAPPSNLVVQFAYCLSNWDVNVNSVSAGGDYGTEYPTTPLYTLSLEPPC